jgi:hypothetical protein
VKIWGIAEFVRMKLIRLLEVVLNMKKHVKLQK